MTLYHPYDAPGAAGKFRPYVSYVIERDCYAIVPTEDVHISSVRPGGRYLEPHKPDADTVRHAESLGIPCGYAARLTGTLWASRETTGALRYWHVL